MSQYVKDILISDFTYPLPDERIARHPLAQRDACKLLVSTASGLIDHRLFSDLPDLIPAGSQLVCNDTRVINARIRFRKETGSQIETFLLEPVAPEDYVLMFQARNNCKWSCLVGNLKRWKDNDLAKTLDINGTKVTLTARRENPLPGNAHVINFSWDNPDFTFASIVDAAGFIPIPPYLKRESEAADADDYQTVYARAKGSVAAPTAGLHFTPETFCRLREKGVDIGHVTLHVGAGTFQPVKSQKIGDHPMHTETFSVTSDLIKSLIDSIVHNRQITAVGTTTVRTLESLPYIGLHLLNGSPNPLTVGQWEAYDSKLQGDALRTQTLSALRALANHIDSCGLPALTAETSIMIAPGFSWRIVNAMVTNFHQPESTLLLLVSSFLGDNSPAVNSPEAGCTPRWRSIYNEALNNGYRFLSYGDACYFKP